MLLLFLNEPVTAPIGPMVDEEVAAAAPITDRFHRLMAMMMTWWGRDALVRQTEGNVW